MTDREKQQWVKRIEELERKVERLEKVVGCIHDWDMVGESLLKCSKCGCYREIRK